MTKNTATPAETKTFSGQELADLIGVKGIQLRRYIRSDGTRVGRGRTYKFTQEEAQSILEGYLAPQKDAPEGDALTELVTGLLTEAAAPEAPEADKS